MSWEEPEASFEHEFLRMETLPRMFERSADTNDTDDAQWYKGGVYDRSMTPAVLSPASAGSYASVTYSEMRAIVRNLTAGFRELGVDHGDRVGIFADTRMEWAQTDFAVLAAGGVVTTVYAESSTEQVTYLLGDSGACGVIAESGDHLDRVMAAEDELSLEFIVAIDEIDGFDDRTDVYTLQDVHDIGAEQYDQRTYESWIDDIDVDDVASLVYTSGTTGEPKGVRLTHRNLRANLNQVFRRYGPRPDRDASVPVVDGSDRLLSYLPLAHIFERNSGHFLQFGVGATVAYAESPDTLQADMALVEPTGMVNVPRIFERIYDGMREQAGDSAIKERIFDWAMAVARRMHREDRPGPLLRFQHRLADELVYSTVKAGLGGQIDLLVSGGGTLSRQLAELFDGMGITIYEGYGMTEAAPVVTTNPPENPKPGTIGPPVAAVDIEVDMSVVPEGRLTSTMGDIGELLVSGPNVVDGYWNDADKTADAFVERDGQTWFRTGDIVTIRPDGYLVFHERTKQMLVLSTGKNVAPQPIEEEFADSSVVEQIMVIGDEEKFVGALVVPNVEGLRRWATSAGRELPEDPTAFAGNEDVRERLTEAIEAVNTSLEPHERIGDFRVITEEFTQDNELLTPTLKKKRRHIRDRHADVIRAIYADDGNHSVANTPSDRPSTSQ